MSENVKTLGFWLVASVVALGATIVSWPKHTEPEIDGVGKVMFEDFTDVLQVASLRIDRFDQELGQLHSFEVTRDKRTDQWSIPSRNGYPADAAVQVRDAATAFLNLKILDVASEVKDDHEKFGVLEPGSNSVKAGDDGVGRLVVLENDTGETMVNLIIGSPVKGNTQQRFVRIPTQDITYVVKFDDSTLTTRFGDWIDENLLQLTSFDVRYLRVRDYSIARTLQGAQLQHRFDARLSVNEAGTWALDSLKSFKDNAATVESMQPDETLNVKMLADLRSSLNDLKIVDVRRKPDGLSHDLQTDAGLIKDPAIVQLLSQKGFFLQQAKDGSGEVFAANGELVVTLKNGIEYLLRFGEIDSQSLNSSDLPENEQDAAGVNRYLLLTVRLNQALFPKPTEEPIPQTWEELGEKEAGQTDVEKKEELEAAQERVRKSNQRLLDEHDERLQQANIGVKALNERFADWYYIVPESQYRKLHLEKDDLIQKKAAEGETPEASATDPNAATDSESETQAATDGETPSSPEKTPAEQSEAKQSGENQDTEAPAAAPASEENAPAKASPEPSTTEDGNSGQSAGEENAPAESSPEPSTTEDGNSGQSAGEENASPSEGETPAEPSNE